MERKKGLLIIVNQMEPFKNQKSKQSTMSNFKIEITFSHFITYSKKEKKRQLHLYLKKKKQIIND